MKTLLLTSLVALAATAQAVTGFGANLITLSFGMHLEDLRLLVAAVVLTGPLLGAPILWIDRKAFQSRLFFRRLLPFSLAGAALGLWATLWISTDGLSTLLGVLVIGFAGREFYRTWRDAAPPRPLSPGAESAVYALGGVFHGLIATGGPVIVFALTRQLTDKSQLRGTMAALLMVLNLLMIAILLPRLEAPMEAVTLAAWLLPGLGVGILVGNWLHHRLPERAFRLALFGLLIGAGLTALR